MTLAELLSIQQDNSDPGIQYQTGQPTLANLTKGRTEEEINQLLSGMQMRSPGFDPNFMSGEPYMPPQAQQMPQNYVQRGNNAPIDMGQRQPMPQNYIQRGNNAPIDLGQSQRQHDVYRDGPQVLGREQMPDGRTLVTQRVAARDGDGRMTAAVRQVIETPDYLNPAKLKELEFRKKQAELTQLQAKPQTESPQQKLANELIAAEARSKLPYTPEGTRLAAIKLEEEKARMGKALPSPAVTSLSAAGAAVEDTSRSKRTFKDEYGGKTIMGRLSNTIGKLVGDDTGQVQWWQDYDSAQNLARNALFGSALTNTEKEAWEMIAVNPRMDADEIKKNIDRKQALEARAASKLGRAYAAGGYSKDQIKELLGDAAVYLESGAPSVTDPSNNAVGAVKVNSVNEAMKLKSGTRFIDPNGVERVRP